MKDGGSGMWRPGDIDTVTFSPQTVWEPAFEGDPDEPMFVFLGRDPAPAEMVTRAWPGKRKGG